MGAQPLAVSLVDIDTILLTCLITAVYSVLVLSPEDGERTVVEAAVGVCEAVLERGVAVEQVDTNMVHNRISSEQHNNYTYTPNK